MSAGSERVGVAGETPAGLIRNPALPRDPPKDGTAGRRALGWAKALLSSQWVRSGQAKARTSAGCLGARVSFAGPLLSAQPPCLCPAGLALTGKARAAVLPSGGAGAAGRHPGRIPDPIKRQPSWMPETQATASLQTVQQPEPQECPRGLALSADTEGRGHCEAREGLAHPDCATLGLLDHG